MRGVAYTVLAIILLASLIQPLTEMVESCRQKILISSALHNSFRAARDRSLNEEDIATIDAVVIQEDFYDYFSEAFSDSLDLYESERSEGAYGHLIFESDDERFNPIRVDFSIGDGPWAYDKETTEVELHVETEYKFKVGYMQKLQDKTKFDPYILEFDRKYILSVKN